MMRWRGVCHVEFSVLDYNDSIAFYDALFGWLGYSSFSSLNMEYQSTYYVTRHVNPHSYIGIQPARTGEKLTHRAQAVGINHIALWARSRGGSRPLPSRIFESARHPRHRRAEGLPAIPARLLCRFL
jgi:catechol 2,3-dioxygenase-like lactoylglutathione lyase family enzyme